MLERMKKYLPYVFVIGPITNKKGRKEFEKFYRKLKKLYRLHNIRTVSAFDSKVIKPFYLLNCKEIEKIKETIKNSLFIVAYLDYPSYGREREILWGKKMNKLILGYSTHKKTNSQVPFVTSRISDLLNSLKIIKKRKTYFLLNILLNLMCFSKRLIMKNKKRKSNNREKSTEAL